MWASPTERARQLKRQQKVLREQEWNARPEWEKRRVVVSLDVVGGKAVRRMGEVERPMDEDVVEDEDISEPAANGVIKTGGAFSRNPLMGKLIRPVWKDKGKGPAAAVNTARTRDNTWRRVQDDTGDDNEAWILDGGVYGWEGGEAEKGRRFGAEERAFG